MKVNVVYGGIGGVKSSESLPLMNHREERLVTTGQATGDAERYRLNGSFCCGT